MSSSWVKKKKKAQGWSVSQGDPQVSAVKGKQAGQQLGVRRRNKGHTGDLEAGPREFMVPKLSLLPLPSRTAILPCVLTSFLLFLTQSLLTPRPLCTQFHSLLHPPPALCQLPSQASSHHWFMWTTFLGTLLVASSIGPPSTATQEEILSELFHENTGTQNGLGLFLQP